MKKKFFIIPTALCLLFGAAGALTLGHSHAQVINAGTVDEPDASTLETYDTITLSDAIGVGKLTAGSSGQDYTSSNSACDVSPKFRRSTGNTTNSVAVKFNVSFSSFGTNGDSSYPYFEMWLRGDGWVSNFQLMINLQWSRGLNLTSSGATIGEVYCLTPNTTHNIEFGAIDIKDTTNTYVYVKVDGVTQISTIEAKPSDRTKPKIPAYMTSGTNGDLTIWDDDTIDHSYHVTPTGFMGDNHVQTSGDNWLNFDTEELTGLNKTSWSVYKPIVGVDGGVAVNGVLDSSLSPVINGLKWLNLTCPATPAAGDSLHVYGKFVNMDWDRAEINAIKIDFTIKYDGSAWYMNTAKADSFVSNYLHMDHTDNDGSCKSEGWYSAAKTAFNALDDETKTTLIDSALYTDAKNRLVAWAAANNETIDTDTNTLGANYLFGLTNDSSADYAVIAAVSAITVVSLLAFAFYKKKYSK